MKIGIIGPGQSGKTTMFQVLLEGGTSGTVGVFKALDSRIDKLSSILSSKKITYPELTFMDLGPVSEFDKKDLSCLQDTDLFVCVIGAFFSEDPRKDFESSITDLILFDLETIQTRIERMEKETRPDTGRELKVLEKCQAVLSDGRLLQKAGLEKEDMGLISGLTLLSLKPLILAINASDEDKDKLKAIEEYSRSKDMHFIRFLQKDRA